MSDQKEKVFADGLFFSKPHENAPEFVKGGLGIKVEPFIEFLRNHKKADGFVNVDMLKSREGKIYFQLNEWEKKQESEEAGF